LVFPELLFQEKARKAWVGIARFLSRALFFRQFFFNISFRVALALVWPKYAVFLLLLQAGNF
jgi:hypothetical protein